MVFNNLISINYCVSQLEKFHSDETLDHTKIVNLCSRALSEIETKAKSGFSPLESTYQDELLHSLHDLQVLAEKSPACSHIHALSTKILDTARAVEGAAHLTEHHPIKQKVDVSILFLNDIDEPDKSGSMQPQVRFALLQEIPCIVSCASFLGTNFHGDLNRTLNRVFGLKAELQKVNNKWEIYSDGKYLVFLPKTNSTDSSLLKKYDLNQSGALKAISIDEIFQGKAQKPDIDSFFDLFQTVPSKNKVFYIIGHGGMKGGTCGFSTSHYNKWLDFLGKQQCKGLAAISCRAGEKLSQLNEQRTEEHKSLPSFLRPKNVSFPILVQSYAAMPTHAEAQKKVLQGLVDFVENAKGHNLRQFKALVRKNNLITERGTEEKIKISLPSDTEETEFYPLNHENDQLVLTDVFLKSLAKKTSTEIKLPLSTRTIALHCAVSNVSIKLFEDACSLKTKDFYDALPSDPLLVSMRPGNAHHFIRSFSSCNSSEDHMKTLSNFYHDSHYDDSLVHKSFFIGQFSDAFGSKLESLALYFHKNTSLRIWKDNANNYLLSVNQGDPKPISQLEHALLCHLISHRTKSSRTFSNDETSFLEAINENYLTSPALDNFSFFTPGKGYNDSLLKNPSKLNEFADQLSVREKEGLCLLLFDLGYHDSVATILENHPVDGKSDFFGSSLLANSIKRQNYHLADLIIKANKESPSPADSGRMLLELCDQYKTFVEQGETHSTALIEDLLNSLLEQPALQLSAFSEKERIALIRKSVAYPQLFEKLLERNLDVKGATGGKALAKDMSDGLTDHIEILLAAGADPNAGNPSAMTLALLSNDWEMVEKLLKHGGQPFSPNEEGEIPFLHAIYKASLPILQKLVELPGCDLNLKGKGALTPHRIAVALGDAQKLQLLESKGAKPPVAK